MISSFFSWIFYVYRGGGVFRRLYTSKLLSDLNNKAQVLLLSSLTAEIRNANILKFLTFTRTTKNAGQALFFFTEEI